MVVVSVDFISLSSCRILHSNWNHIIIYGFYNCLISAEYAYTRKVNEKVDVFGFGVVLLELTTGRKANDGGEHGSLAEWAGHHYRSGSIRDATDICIRYAGYTDEIETVFRLGVRCTCCRFCSDAASRRSGKADWSVAWSARRLHSCCHSD